MHAGNIFSALMAWLIAKSQGGDIVLRIEDLDRERSKPHYFEQIQRDFEELGLTWDRGPFYQHDRDEAYQAAYRTLEEQGLLYPCFCTRADLHAASAPHAGEKRIYAGTCRNLTEGERALRLQGLILEDGRLSRNPALRIVVPSETVRFHDLLQGEQMQDLARDCGDFVIRRSDGTFAYQLAVVVDDAEQQVNSVVRGVDLLDSTPQQMHLQNLLGYGAPQYAHVPLMVAPDGRRLSKRNRDAEYGELLVRYKTPAAVMGHIAFVAGLIDADEPVTPDELLKTFSLTRARLILGSKTAITFR